MSYQYLALGDSYTIGEAVPLIHSFPYQTVQLLRAENIEINAPEVIAKTGWTTGELQEAINVYRFASLYDVVSMLIGVNNQYRGLSLEDYKRDLKHLLNEAIQLAGGKSKRVFVLSIPDYSVTPFALAMDVAKIERELEAFNAAKKELCTTLSVHHINITESTRQAKNNVHLLAADGLHPSAAAYNEWALQLAHKLKSVLS